ncbi:MAG: Fe-S cluster assembly protein NifU [Desulfobacterales bacterium]|jgi:NifU-like protein|nr:Fe-S cluster assembly protein NifU [Desulfobacteraceae bacterium]MDD3991296.1 Fe-S cluster assembly protein NifU [Desulfobacteraceae bacterium]MDY0311591.1 Fe-S cluster assembly protein NifU [Desulfobacterales bacterium]
MWDYTEKVKDHFLNPRNVGRIEEADAVGEVGSLACGDALTLYLKLDDQQRIQDAKFQTFGCASAIASSSALTEMVKGKTLEEAREITNEHIAEYLGGLPKEKMHCSVMGRDALEKAISCYLGEPDRKTEGQVVCECFGVTDVQIREAVADHQLKSIEDVTDYLKAGGACGNCHEKIQEIIWETLGLPDPVKKPPAMTNIQKIRRIEETLENEIRPALKKDGGDIQLVDVDGNRVLIKLRGACATCKLSQATLKDFVEARLRETVTPELVVEEVPS